VRDAREDHPLEVAEDLLERLPLLRGALGQRRADLARLDPREHRVALAVFQVIRDPLDETVPFATEFGAVHVARQHRVTSRAASGNRG
jgi:hypothetical protein